MFANIEKSRSGFLQTLPKFIAFSFKHIYEAMKYTSLTAAFTALLESASQKNVDGELSCPVRLT